MASDPAGNDPKDSRNPRNPRDPNEPSEAIGTPSGADPSGPPTRSRLAGSAAAVARHPARSAALLAVLVLGRALVYAAGGVDFVLDDWSFAGYLAAHGTMTDAFLRSRPGTWAVQSVLFGVAGDHPLVLFALVTALFLGVTLLLHRVLLRFVAPTLALATAAVWVLMPNHNTIALWGATMPTLVALGLLLGAVLLLADGRWLPAAVLLALSVVTYELFVPLCLVAPFVVPGPLQAAVPVRTVRPVHRVVVAGAALAAAAYVAARPLYPRDLRVPDPVVFWSGHFGTGLFATADPPAVLRLAVAGVVAVAVVVCLVAWLRGARGRDDGPALVVAGLVIMALSAWVGFTLPLGAFGQNDRLYASSSIGAAIVVVGVVRHAWLRLGAGDPARRGARLAIGAGVGAFVLLCLVGQRISLQSWLRAGDDAVAVVDYVQTNAEGDPGASHFVIGPERIYRNAVTGIQSGDAKWVFRLTFGDDATGTLRVADTPADFVPRTDHEVLVEWADVVPDAPPGSP